MTNPFTEDKLKEMCSRRAIDNQYQQIGFILWCDLKERFLVPEGTDRAFKGLHPKEAEIFMTFESAQKVLMTLKNSAPDIGLLFKGPDNWKIIFADEL